MTHLCPDLQHVLERHASISELALQQHNDVMVVLLQLLALWRLGVLRLALLDIRLQLSNLLVDIGNVLFDDIGEFLGKMICSVSGSDEASGQNAR